MSATEAHSKKNINKSIDEALAVLGDVAQAAADAGLRVRGYLSTVFGCPYEGKVDPAQPLALIKRLFDMGVYEVSLGDTIGMATPNQVQDLCARMKDEFPLERIALHMHDTRGTALANVLAGLDGGIRIFDSAFGGLGGCPYAPGASGNLATEDLVYMLDGMGFSTGVDMDHLVEASIHASDLVGRPLPSKMLQSEIGRRKKDEVRAARQG